MKKTPKLSSLVLTSFLVAGNLMTLPALASEYDPPTANAASGDPEPEKGSGQIAGGIVMVSVGAGLGVLTLLFGALGGCSEHQSDESCERQGRGWLLTSVALIGVGTGVGIPLIVSGAHERREWKQWKKRQSSGTEKNTASLRLNIAPMQRGAAALLTYDLP